MEDGLIQPKQAFNGEIIVDGTSEVEDRIEFEILEPDLFCESIELGQLLGND